MCSRLKHTIKTHVTKEFGQSFADLGGTIWTRYLHLTKENVDEEMLCKWKNKCSKALSLGYLFQWFYLC